MKHFLNLYLFFFIIIVQGQNLSLDDSALKSNTDPIATTGIYSYDTKNDQKEFIKAAKDNSVHYRTIENLNNVVNGYYAISGVFRKDKNLEKQIEKLNKKGFNSGYFQNTEDSMYYLYLNFYDTWKSAIADYASDFNGYYTKKSWILKVTNSVAESEIHPNNTPLKNLVNAKTDDFEDIQIGKTNSKNTDKAVTSENLDKLLEKADSYFNKMWYAEAAKLYELALSQQSGNYSLEVLQKAGDAHYFNTDMERAYKFYTLLYEKYEDQISADYIFKYAHALKGTGNYTRSKRLMNLYNRKMNTEANKNSYMETVQRENILLDNIIERPKEFDIKNIQINSQYSDFSPMFYGEDKVVYASAMDSSVFNARRYKWNNQPYLDLYTAKLNEESQELNNAVKFSKKINTKYHEASVTFSPDKETIYFTRNNYGKKLKRDKKGINNLKIYQSKKINGEWTVAKELPFNSDEYSTGHPALSSDGKQLYFVSDMPGSLGETDIFMVDILEDGSFSEPRNLGPEINTEQKEMFPFINDQKLYFSSDGHTGLGGLDIFEVAFNDDSGFLEVRNLGKPVNSNKDDFSYIVNEETQKGYFASNRDGGKGDDDIYSFKRLEIEETTTATNAIAGVITELVSGEQMPAALIQLLDENNMVLKEMEGNEDGSFVFEDLESNKRYYLKTTKENYYEDIREAATKQNELINIDVSLHKLNNIIAVEKGIRKLKTEMIHFNFDKFFIRDDAALELDKLVTVLKDNPSMVIKIESHTDSRGDAVYNKYLSDKRAKSTRDYIISQGIGAERIESAIGYGEEQLLNNCDGSIACTEEQHYYNRRSEFIIVNM